MATILEAKDLASPQNQNMSTVLKEIKDIAQLFKEGIERVAQIRGMAGGQQAQNNVIVSNGSPRSIPSTGAKQIETTQIKEVVMQLDKEKVKSFLRELIEEQAQKLPDDIKNKTVGELVGENFKTFTYTYSFKGIPVPLDKESILDAFADKFVEIAPKLTRGDA